MKRFFEFTKDLGAWALSISTVLICALFGVGLSVIWGLFAVAFYVVGIFALLAIVPVALVIVLFVLIIEPSGNSGKLEGNGDGCDV